MKSSSDAKSRTLSIQKVLDAPVDLVWEAWTNPEHVIQWWAPPGMKIEVLEHDFRVGGRWKYSMPMPDGSQFVSEGTYLEIDAPRRIVTSADFKPMTEGVELHVTFEADGEQTNFTFSVVHETEDYAKAQERMGFYNGWGSAFNRMAAVIAGMGG
ncbi:MAG: SRPBCC domain-containing protein [Bacteroidia bacterium]